MSTPKLNLNSLADIAAERIRQQVEERAQTRRRMMPAPPRGDA